MTPTRQYLGAVVLVLSACGGSPAPAADAAAPDTLAVRTAIQARMRDMAAAVTAGNVPGIVGIYTPDAYLREPGFAVQGADSIGALLATVLKSVEVVELTADPERYVYAGDRVVEFAAYRERLRDRASGAETVCDCRYAAEWVRGSDGQWRIGYLLAGPKGEVPAGPAAQKP